MRVHVYHHDVGNFLDWRRVVLGHLTWVATLAVKSEREGVPSWHDFSQVYDYMNLRFEPGHRSPDVTVIDGLTQQQHRELRLHTSTSVGDVLVVADGPLQGSAWVIKPIGFHLLLPAPGVPLSQHRGLGDPDPLLLE